MSMRPELADEIQAASNKFYSVGDKHRDEMAAYAMIRAAEIAAAATPKPGPEDCCRRCSGSGVEKKSRSYYDQSIGRTAANIYYTITCTICGGRGFLMPWQKKEESPDG